MFRIPIYKVELVREASQPATANRISSSQVAADIFATYLDGVDREHLVVAMLDTKNKVIGINTVSVGTLNQSVVHPREVFKPAILSNAAGIILAHNHPSGDPTPSHEDQVVTGRIVRAASCSGSSSSTTS